ncbi:MAG TPA: YCF48-related protein [Terriglobales bacterium]|nr:YCF48-related protein [Terriglobales bacterium]
MALRVWKGTQVLLFLLLAVATVTAGQNPEPKSLGPDGGDVRRLAYVPDNPSRVFLATSSGRLYVSDDGGHNWSRFAHLGGGFDYVLDSIVISPADSRLMYVAGWSIERNSGELFRSRDGGKTWTSLPGMQGKSIRSLTISESNPDVLVAGTLENVFRSDNGGDSWKRISPENHPDIKTIQSVAIDPKNPDVIYAGTWHLAWKTRDGGANWHQINRGMIDDSDVFSIIVDKHRPSLVYASACSGIYRSEAEGEQFQKIQGIPFSARRTRVLKQDPSDPSIVYAGTTEGLYKTVDAGKSWKRVSSANLVINDVMVNPTNSNVVLLATDRMGVLYSTNGGVTFTPSNHGFTHRQVNSILVDNRNPSLVYAGLLNDKDSGGVFTSQDEGAHWTQMSAGLGGHDVFVIRQDSKGNLFAATNGGLFRYSEKSHIWMKAPVVHGNLRVSDVSVEGKHWFAATSEGLFRSQNSGATWSLQIGVPHEDFIAVHTNGQRIAAITHTKLFVSEDNGAKWQQTRIPLVAFVSGMTMENNGAIWLNSPQGVYRQQAGQDWNMVPSIADGKIISLTYDPRLSAVVAVTNSAHAVYASADGNKWQKVQQIGVPTRNVTFANGRMFAATSFDGVVTVDVKDKYRVNGSTQSGGGGN